jgi:WD40 repeat protein
MRSLLTGLVILCVLPTTVLRAPTAPPPTSGNPSVQLQPPRTDVFGDLLPPGAIARFGTVRWRPGSECFALSYAPDGQTLISVDGTNCICVWEVATGKKLKQFGRFPKLYGCAAISRDGRWIALAGQEDDYHVWPENRFSIWDATTGRHVLSFVEPRASNIGDIVAALAFSPDGTMLAARSYLSCAVTLWDTKNGARLRGLGERTVVDQWEGSITPDHFSMAFSRDGKMLAVASEWKKFGFWSFAAGIGAPTYVGWPRDCSAPVFSPDSKHVAWVEEREIYLGTHIWAAKPLVLNDRDHLDPAKLAFSPDGRTLAVMDKIGVLHAWDVATRKRKQESQAMPAQSAWSSAGYLTFSPDGKTISAAYGPTIFHWDTATGAECVPRRGHCDSVRSAALSSDCRTLVSFGDDETLYIWDAQNGIVRKRMKAPLEDRGLSKLMFLPDDRAFVFEEDNGEIWKRDAETGVKICPFSARIPTGAYGNILSQLAPPLFRPYLKHVVWAAENLNAEQTSQLFGLSVDRKQVITHESAGFLCYWDLATRKLARRVPFSYTPWTTSGWLASDLATEAKRVVWFGSNNNSFDDSLICGEKQSDKELSRTRKYRRGFGAAFAENRLAVAVAARGDDAAIAGGNTEILFSLIEIHTGKDRRQFVGPEEAIDKIAFSPDDRLIATVSTEGIARIWEVASGALLHAWKPHGSGVPVIFFSSNGKYLVTAGTDSTLLVWDIAALTKGQKPSPPANVSDAALEKLWIDLGAADAARGFDAIYTLSGAPEKATTMLKSRLKPVPAIALSQVESWIRQLQSDSFAVREKATSELERLGELAKPALDAALEPGISLEQRMRIERLRQIIKQNPVSSDQIRCLRALEVAEKIGTPDAIHLIDSLTQGAPEARLTQEAEYALKRLRARPR